MLTYILNHTLNRKQKLLCNSEKPIMPVHHVIIQITKVFARFHYWLRTYRHTIEAYDIDEYFCLVNITNGK